MKRVLLFWCALLVAVLACQAPARIISDPPPEVDAPAVGSAESTQPTDPVPEAAAAEPLSLILWQEPRAGAFAANVPQGWLVQGSMNSSFGLLHRWMEMAKPDGSAAIQIGYRELALNLLPHPVLDQAGYPAGTTVPIGNGLQALVAEFESGEAVAEAEARARLQTVCTDLTISNRRNTVAADAGPELETSEGAVDFQCTAQEVALAGEFHAVTRKVIDPEDGSGIWFSDDIAWYVGAVGQGGQAAGAFQAVVDSLSFEPQWVEAQKPVPGIAGLYYDQSAQASGSSGQFVEDDFADFFARQITGP